jgi:phosphatidylglycerol:prolipoprotein diacylglycerol transferase
MHPILFHLPDWFPLMGGAPITSFGLFMLLAFVTAGYANRAELDRLGYDPEKAWDFVFMAVIGGILGAKTYYILLNWHQLLTDPIPLIFARGGLVWYGGFIGAAILVIWEMRKSKLPLGDLLDSTAAPLSIAYAVGRIGCFMVGDDWGRPTGSWVGIRFPQGTPPTRVDIIQNEFGIHVDPALVEKYGQIVPVHPTQLYEVAMSTLIFLFLWKIRRHNHRPGWLLMVWLCLAGMERFIVEFFRAKDDRFVGIFTLAQMISLLVIAVGLVGMARLKGEPETKRARAR